jgi:hypothetical protein
MSRKVGEALAEADAWRGGCRMNSTGGPVAGGRPVGRMNSASRGLRPTVGLRRPGRCLLRRRRPTPGAERLGRPISIGVKAFGRRSACVPNEFGLPGPSADGRPAPTGRVSFASAEADAWRAAPWEADFNRREGLRPAVGLVCRMNSASRGLRPTVGLRRPGGCLLRRRRPTPGAQRLGRPISIGVKAFGRRIGLPGPVPNEAGLARAPWGRFQSVGLRRPGRCLLRRRRPTPGAQRLGRPISNRREGLRPAVGRRWPNEFGLQGPSADGRPAPTGRCLLRRRRPTPGAQRLGRPISIGVKAFGRRSAYVPNEFGLPGPSADGRPAPTGRVSFASAEADAWRAAPWEADFNRREGLRPAIGLCAE